MTINTWIAFNGKTVSMHTSIENETVVINKVVVGDIEYTNGITRKDYSGTIRLEFEDRKATTLPDEIDAILWPKKVTVPVIKMKATQPTSRPTYSNQKMPLGWCNRCHSSCYGDCRA